FIAESGFRITGRNERFIQSQSCVEACFSLLPSSLPEIHESAARKRYRVICVLAQRFFAIRQSFLQVPQSDFCPTSPIPGPHIPGIQTDRSSVVVYCPAGFTFYVVSSSALGIRFGPVSVECYQMVQIRKCFPKVLFSRVGQSTPGKGFTI